MALSVAAYFLFSLHDATNKWLVASLPVWEVMFVRSTVILLVCLAIGRQHLVVTAIATPLKRPMALRGLLTLSAWLCFYSAARDMPLAQLLTLYFAAPLVVTALSAPLLGERVTPVRWASVAIGFLGVLVASDPFGVLVAGGHVGVRPGWATLLVLMAAAMWGYTVILMRQVARRESTLLQMAFSNLVLAAGSGVMCLFQFVPPSEADLLLLAGVAVFGGGGQYLMFEAARRSPAAVMATVEYSALLWAFILGFVIWHDIPTLAVWLGAVLIVIAGVILLAGERRAGRARAVSATSSASQP